MPRSLDPYRRKRHPGRTPEPFAGVQPKAAAAQRFVVQQHAARRLHWDLRLEIGGVLVSWAVPRGPSVDIKERRLAVQTEDHPLEYAGFEGLIPAGNYGAGAMIVWDAGRYRTVDGVAPADGLAAGKLDLELIGHKLRGRWALVRTKGEDGRQWLFFKKADAASGGAEPVLAQPASVLSGLTVIELRDGVRRDAELAAQAAAAGAPRATLPAGALKPMLATPTEKPFSRDGWVFELKYDGIRLLIDRRGGGAPRLLARSGRDVTATFPEIAAAAARLPADDFTIDGEVIALDERGTGSFERLQPRLGLTNSWDVERAAAAIPVQVFAFDLLAAAGHDLRGLPLTARKALLRRLVPAAGVVRYADHIESEGEAFFAAASEHEVEGVVGKRAASPYRSGVRSPDWLKVKRPQTNRFTVVGFVPGKGTRAPLGALMLAWRRGDQLVHAGNVGSGLSDAIIDAILPSLREAARPAPAFEVGADPLPRNAVFVEPHFLAEVRYTEVTERGALRQPVLLGVRADLPLADGAALPGQGAASPPSVFQEADASPTDVPRGAPAPARAPRRSAIRFAPSNTNKVFWPDDGYTKGDLLAYYDAIWPAIAPYLRDRPVVLTRYPDGIAGKSFFQKHAPEFVPDWVPTVRVEDTEYFLCNDKEALLYIINLGCIPLHVWSARRQHIERPDWVIIDLDPKGAPRADVIAVAKCLHALLEPLGVPHFLKTSGQDGLHIMLPLGAQLTHDEAKTFGEVLARLVVAELPQIATVARALGSRGGKVYVDFLQNGSGKLIAAPYSVRPRPGATVSTPLAWKELTARLDPARFTIKTVPPRYAKLGDPLLPIFDTPVDVGALLGELQNRHR
ncbi:MAG: DNA ligase D [Deltaproteobacteria bacterium]|nr:DNA ligase D [Deltaproteobacteria bacterium]